VKSEIVDSEIALPRNAAMIKPKAIVASFDHPIGVKIVVKLLLFVLCVAMSGHFSIALANMDLARQKNCLACHAVDKKHLGPAYKDVAAKYDGQPGAVDMLVAKVMQGGSGVWGAAAMPANRVTPAEAKQLVEWVLSLNHNALQEQPLPSAPANELVTKAATSAAVKIGADGANLQRGKYLVESILACGNCHSGNATNFGTPGQALSGGRAYDLPAFRVTAGNLTSDPETGLGEWTVEDLKRALVHGVRPNGLPLAPGMPWAFFKALTEEDLNAVANYVLSLPPVRNPTPGPVYRKEFHEQVYPDAQRPFTAHEIATDQMTRGRYLATLGHCMGCHTPEVDGVSDFVRDGGRGGRRLGPEKVLVPNITSSPTAGLGAWTNAEIKRALTQGISRDGRHLHFPMPWPYLASLDEADVDALVSWLRTLPPRG
jgi:cytochrome c551/c552